MKDYLNLEGLAHFLDRLLDNFVLRSELISAIKQPDWNQTDETAKDFIKNKPNEATEVDILKLLLELDMLSVVFDENEAMLTDENDAILLI